MVFDKFTATLHKLYQLDPFESFLNTIVFTTTVSHSSHRLSFLSPSLIPLTISHSSHHLSFLSPSLIPLTISHSSHHLSFLSPSPHQYLPINTDGCQVEDATEYVQSHPNVAYNVPQHPQRVVHLFVGLIEGELFF